MKKIYCLISVAIFTIGFLAIAQSNEKKELRPSQKIMQARAGWMKSMNENLTANKLAEVGKNAKELSGQTKKVGDNLQGEKKELTLKISALAGEIVSEVNNKNVEGIKAKIGDIKAVCADCHAKYRDKK